VTDSIAFKLAVAGTVLAATTPAFCADETQALTFCGSLGYESEYVNMGTQYAENIYVPTVEVGYGDFYTGIWMAVPDEHRNLYDTEADFYAGWRHALNDTFSVDVGATRYAYDEIVDNFLSRDDTLEFYVGLTSTLPLSPAFYAYRDIDCDTNTFKLKASHSFALAKALDLCFSGDIGYIQGNTESYSFHTLNADLEYKLSENTSARGGLRFGGSSEKRIFGDGCDKDWKRDALWFGFSIGTGF
jgi:uncharacterized protein (TIGR02001 family)